MISQGKIIDFEHCEVDGGLIASDTIVVIRFGAIFQLCTTLHQNTAVNQIKVNLINLRHITIHIGDIECNFLFFRSEFGINTEIRTVPEKPVHRLTCYSHRPRLVNLVFHYSIPESSFATQIVESINIRWNRRRLRVEWVYLESLA